LVNENVKRSAEGMIRAYGRQAVEECHFEVDKYRRRNDPQAVAVWESVLHAVQEMEMPLVKSRLAESDRRTS